MSVIQTFTPSALIVTDRAVTKVQSLKAEENNEDLKLRVYVTGGGCSGFQYGFSFESEMAEDDTPVSRDGVTVLIDSLSYQYLAGSTVDYEVDLDHKNIILKTNLDLSIPLDKDHKLELKEIGDEQIPFVQIRNNIEGFISRSVYYSLIEVALMQDNGSKELLTLKSFDCDFELGEMND